MKARHLIENNITFLPIESMESFNSRRGQNTRRRPVVPCSGNQLCILEYLELEF